MPTIELGYESVAAAREDVTEQALAAIREVTDDPLFKSDRAALVAALMNPVYADELPQQQFQIFRRALRQEDSMRQMRSTLREFLNQLED